MVAKKKRRPTTARSLLVGARVRERREKLGFNQRDFAYEVGLYVNMLSRIENGHQDVLGSTALRIAESLNCSLDWLAGRSSRVEIQ